MQSEVHLQAHCTVACTCVNTSTNMVNCASFGQQQKLQKNRNKVLLHRLWILMNTTPSLVHRTEYQRWNCTQLYTAYSRIMAVHCTHSGVHSGCTSLPRKVNWPMRSSPCVLTTLHCSSIALHCIVRWCTLGECEEGSCSVTTMWISVILPRWMCELWIKVRNNTLHFKSHTSPSVLCSH